MPPHLKQTLLISLDKDSYNNGDKGEMSVIWSASSGGFGRSGAMSSVVPIVSLIAEIVSDNGKQCTRSIDTPLVQDSNNPTTKIPFTVKATCKNPHVSASLVDKDGKVFDQKDFTFTTGLHSDTKPNNTGKIALMILIVLAIVGVLIIKKRQHGDAIIKQQ